MTVTEASKEGYSAMYVRLCIDMKGWCLQRGIADIADEVKDGFLETYGLESLDTFKDYFSLTTTFHHFVSGVIWNMNQQPLPVC